MHDWNQITIDGVVTLAVPDGITARLEDDQTMVVLTLPGEPATDILMGWFPLEFGRVVSPSLAREQLADFMERCVRPVAPIKGVSIEPAADVADANLCVWQAVAEVEGDDRWWLARVYGRLESTEVLLAHWNGPAKQLKAVVLPAFVSIDPLITSRRPRITGSG